MSPMEGLDTIAEVAIGLAGFSGIVVAFIHRKGVMTALDKLRLGVLLYAAFGAVLLALLPFGLGHVGLEGAHLWATASAVHAVVSALQIAGLIIVVRRYFAVYRPIFNLMILVPVISMYVANTVLQVLNLSGALWAPMLGPYYLGLIWLVVHAGLQFSRIIFVRTEGEEVLAATAGPADGGAVTELYPGDELRRAG